MELELLLLNFTINLSKDFPVPSNQICPKFGNFVFELESSRANSMGVPSSLDNILARGVSKPHSFKSKRFVTKRVLEFKLKDDWTIV